MRVSEETIARELNNETQAIEETVSEYVRKIIEMRRTGADLSR